MLSCWHTETAESYAMWKIYGQHEFSLCIETTVAKLQQPIQECNSSLATYSAEDEFTVPINNKYKALLIKS